MLTFTSEDIDYVFSKYIKAHPEHEEIIKELLLGLIAYAQVQALADEAQSNSTSQSNVKILAGHDLEEAMLEYFLQL